MTAENDEPRLEEGLLSAIRKELPRSRSPLAYSRVTVLLCGIAVLAYLTVNIRSRLSSQPSSQRTVDSLYSSTWAQYAPYRPVAEYAGPPDGCIITQVNILQRHGARFPTEGAESRILKALGKLLSAAPYKNPRLRFLKNYKYGLGTDVMVAYGAHESFESGREAYWRYRSLVNTSVLPFIRSDASQRDVDSAFNWTAGFSVASQHKLVPTVSLIMDAAARNNTLDGSQCPAAGRGEEQKSLWLATHYTQITVQLNADAPGALLDNEDTYNLMSLCPFETLAYRRKSPWCLLFESIPGAFEAFEYTGDLDKFYKTGYGESLGPVQGVGYINELLARLAGLPVQDHTQTNQSLDHNAATFPLNRTVYVDFSHDNQMIAIFSAMGLFRQNKPLDPIKADSSRTWRVSAIVPFAGRMVVERLDCSRREASADLHSMVRVLVQDQVQPLEFCDADEDGMCTLDAFIHSQAYARNDGKGDWEKCFE